MRAAILKQAILLPVTVRIKLVQDIWDSIAAEPNKVPVTAAQMRELNRRRKLLQKDPDRAISWEIAKHRISKRVAKTAGKKTKIRAALRESEKASAAGHVVSQDEVVRRFRSWRKK